MDSIERSERTYRLLGSELFIGSIRFSSDLDCALCAAFVFAAFVCFPSPAHNMGSAVKPKRKRLRKYQVGFLLFFLFAFSAFVNTMQLVGVDQEAESGRSSVRWMKARLLEAKLFLANIESIEDGVDIFIGNATVSSMRSYTGLRLSCLRPVSDDILARLLFVAHVEAHAPPQPPLEEDFNWDCCVQGTEKAELERCEYLTPPLVERLERMASATTVASVS